MKSNDKVTINPKFEEWDESEEEIGVEEDLFWLSACDDKERERVASKCLTGWIRKGPKNPECPSTTEFCDSENYTTLIEIKLSYGYFTDKQQNIIKKRANPYELIGKNVFLNRSAVKMANLDKLSNWLISQETDAERRMIKNPLDSNGQPSPNRSNKKDRFRPIFYFADLCAGPGGFSEYILYRKGFYNSKCYMFTFKEATYDDLGFQPSFFRAASPTYIETYYGVDSDGDIRSPQNIASFQKYINEKTNRQGLSLVMADGIHNVHGSENLQEILMKRMYLAQLLIPLCVLKEGGNCVSSIFDIFTPFSAGLVYLISICYDQISIHKPVTSRPANAERYIICKGLRKQYSNRVRDYLKKINNMLDQLEKNKSSDDIISIFPTEDIQSNKIFMSYLLENNNKICCQQIKYLRKYHNYGRNKEKKCSFQTVLPKQCLKFWELPNVNPYVKPYPDTKEPLGYVKKKAVREECKLNQENFDRPLPDFSIDFFKNKEGKSTYAEYICNFVSDSQRPQLFIKLRNDLYICDHMNLVEDKPICSLAPEFKDVIPSDTILYGEIVEVYEKDTLIEKKKAIRILDAALLSGDNISGLKYIDRRELISKFCKTLSFSAAQTINKYGNEVILTVADYFNPKDLKEVRKKQIKLIQIKNAEKIIITEGDLQFLCAGVRFSRLIKKEWKMTGDSVELKEAIFNKNIVKETKFYERQIWASFENCCFSQQVIPSGLMQSIWRWNNPLDDTYTQREILRGKEHPRGLTIESFLKMLV